MRSNSFVNIINPQGHTEVVRYDQFVKQLFKVDTWKEMNHHAKGGVCEEAGELSNAIKQHITFGAPLGSIMKGEKNQTVLQNIVEELGDIRFYMEAVCHLYGITEEEILQKNADKLSKRYVGLRYSDDAAQNRADKG